VEVKGRVYWYAKADVERAEGRAIAEIMAGHALQSATSVIGIEE